MWVRGTVIGYCEATGLLKAIKSLSGQILQTSRQVTGHPLWSCRLADDCDLWPMTCLEIEHE
jgi:hypothetical protein